jgi:hypothetical protein
MQIHKLEIENPPRWDVAEAHQFLASGREAVMKSKVHRETTESQVMVGLDISVSDFAYQVFRDLREQDGINDDTIQDSLRPFINN